MYTVNTKINNQLSIWLITMFWIVSIMIVVGGLTRLTDSGLSITEWQLFSGFFPPLNQNDWILYFNLYKEIPEFKLQNNESNVISPNRKSKDYKEKFRKRLAYDEILSNFLIISFLKKKDEYRKSNFICKKFTISKRLIKKLTTWTQIRRLNF